MIAPLKPRAGKQKWVELAPHPMTPPNTVVYRRGKIQVLSSLALAAAPDGSGDTIPQWHASITRRGKRPTARDVEIALEAFFGRVRPEEDNHHPGEARHFWLPVDPTRRVDCECKTDEVLVVDVDGYAWSNAKDGQCRGCELEALALSLRRRGVAVTFRSCPIHGGV